MAYLFTNNATAALSASITNAQTNLTLLPGQGALFPNPSFGDSFFVTLDNNAGTLEIVECTSRSGDVLTVLRGQDNTTANGFSLGAKVELRPTAKVLATFSQTLPVYLRNILNGFVFSTAASNSTITINQGQCANTGNTVLIDLPALLNKTAAVWGAGSGAGGVSAGAPTANTIYYPYVIRRPDTGAVDVLFDLSPSTPNLSASGLVPYTQFRRLPWILMTTSTATIWQAPISRIAALLGPRQCVKSCPLDASGVPSYSINYNTTLNTAIVNPSLTSPIVVQASGGLLAEDRIGVFGANFTWTTTNAFTDHFFLVDVSITGVCTPITTIIPIVYSRRTSNPPTTANGAHTFLVDEMQMYVGDGTQALPVHRVPVFEGTPTVGILNLYSTNGVVERQFIAPLPPTATLVSNAVNMGHKLYRTEIELECLVADAGYSVGDRISNLSGTNATYAIAYTIKKGPNIASFATSTNAPFIVYNGSTGGVVVLTLASWGYRICAYRNF